MKDFFSQLGFQDNLSPETAEQMLPVLQAFRDYIDEQIRILNEKVNSKQDNPCDSCKKYDNCNGECDKLKLLLLKEQTGGSHREKKINLNMNLFQSLGQQSKYNNNRRCKDRSNLKNITKIPSSEISDRYKKYWLQLSSRQRKVLELHFKGMPQNKIAENLKKSPSSVCTLLKRAKQRIQELEREDRKAMFDLKKGYLRELM